MKLWLLISKSSDIYIVRAETELHAREILSLSEQGSPEYSVMWLNNQETECRELLVVGTPEVVLGANSNEWGLWGNWDK